MAVDIARIASLLDASLDPRQNKQAELAIKQEETKNRFSLTLLQIVASNSYAHKTRLASALFFKNFIRRNWINEDGEHKLPADEVSAIKSELIGLMIAVPVTIQAQLGEAVSVIADSDFWERWTSLVDDLVSRLTPDNPTINNGVLQVAHSIFKRWRPLFRSDALFTEINHVLEKFSTPLLTLFQNVDQAITQSENAKDSLQQHAPTLILIIQLIYDLSCQDLPPVFEENIDALGGLFLKYLTYDNKLLHTDTESDSGPLEYIKAGIFEILQLYTQKYEDAVTKSQNQFIQTSWELLTTIGKETKYDVLVSKALQFLTSVVKIKQHAEVFNKEEVMGKVVENVVLPNISLRESDVELFEDEPIEYIRRDLEGSDSGARRTAATDFLRALMEQFETMTTQVVTKYINHYLAESAKNPAQNWKEKDTAVFLFSSIAAKGTLTATRGVTSTNSSVDILSFFQTNIASDLTDAKVQPILQVDAIKFLYMFRSQLTKEQWQAAFPLLVNHLGSSQYVVYTYAAVAVERVLYMTDDKRRPIIDKEAVIPLANDLLHHLFSLITKDPKPEKMQENEFLMKTVMRVLIVMGESVSTVLETVSNQLINITKIIQHNPSNPRFYYYHFESIGALIRFASSSHSAYLETAYYQPFAEILQTDVQEFQPYVFQLFAALLEVNPSGAMSEYYLSLVGPVLELQLYNSRGNVPALVRLLTAIINRGAANILANNQLQAVLLVFQKLLASKANETYAFDLLETVICKFNVESLQPFFTHILELIYTRLSGSKTETLTMRFVRFYHLFSAKDEEGLGADLFIAITDRIQDIFTPIYTKIVLPETQKLARPYDRKTAVVSLTHTLATSEAFVERYGKRGWAFTCEALLKLLINPPLPPTTDDLHVIEDKDVDDVGFGVGFTALNTCRLPQKDPFPAIQDVKVWVGSYLKTKDQATSGRIGKYVQERLTPDAQSALQGIMQA